MNIKERELPQSPELTVEQEAQRETALSAKEQPSLIVEKEANISEKISGLTRRIAKPKKAKSTTIPQVRDHITVDLEKVLEDGLVEAYRSLSRVEQQEFKIKGEQVTFQLRQMMQSSTLKVKKVFSLIFEWLRLLPGVNTFFLEQEAKIKADAVIMIHRRMHHK